MGKRLATLRIDCQRDGRNGSAIIITTSKLINEGMVMLAGPLLVSIRVVTNLQCLLDRTVRILYVEAK